MVLTNALWKSTTAQNEFLSCLSAQASRNQKSLKTPATAYTHPAQSCHATTPQEGRWNHMCTVWCHQQLWKSLWDHAIAECREEELVWYWLTKPPQNRHTAGSWALGMYNNWPKLSSTEISFKERINWYWSNSWQWIFSVKVFIIWTWRDYKKFALDCALIKNSYENVKVNEFIFFSLLS